MYDVGALYTYVCARARYVRVSHPSPSTRFPGDLVGGRAGGRVTGRDDIIALLYPGRTAGRVLVTCVYIYTTITPKYVRNFENCRTFSDIGRSRPSRAAQGERKRRRWKRKRSDELNTCSNGHRRGLVSVIINTRLHTRCTSAQLLHGCTCRAGYRKPCCFFTRALCPGGGRWGIIRRTIVLPVG